jgi:hypothetical protein
VAPLFIYNYANNGYYQMAIPEAEYLDFTLIVVLAFALGLFSIKSNINTKKLSIDSDTASKVGRALVFIGFFSEVAMNFIPDALKSAVNFFVLFKQIGVYALIFSNRSSDKYIVGFFSLSIAAGSILGGMLIDFIIYAIFFAMFLALKYKITNKFKYLAIGFGFVFLTIYQSIKQNYREMVWGKEVSITAKIAILNQLITPETISNAFNKDIVENESLTNTMHRLSQGWHISKIYKKMPDQLEHEDGKLFLKDVASALLPRFLWPDKSIVNDYLKFRHYTGYPLNKGTAMSVGVIGDFYINFGKVGAVIAMFLFGAFIAWIKKIFLIHFVNNNTINLIWLPFIFSYLIRPGNEFYFVLNHILKSVVILFIVFRIIYPNIKVYKQEEQLETPRS